MLQIAICDDEKIICEQLKKIIVDYQEQNYAEMSVSVFYNGEDIYEKLEKGQFYDLIFMDIELYQLNGIDVSRYIRNEQENETTQIVFISSKQNYAMDLFSIRPLDFIIKPVSYDRIAFCLDYVIKRKKQHKAVFTYQVAGITKTVLIDEILYLQSNSRKIFIKTQRGSDFFYGKLDLIQEQLPSDLFLRIHKSTLISYMWVSNIKNLDITMKDNAVLQISHPRKKAIYRQLNENQKKGVLLWD